ncbi:MAG: tRNA lysidine(34) synthetase TilS [Clostridia bacterium]|nr:tRNA lysidine(34) synthetase TilS [Clostridia bacterium]
MFKEKIVKTITKYNLIQNGDKIVIGLSGGPDSISLINVLNEIRNDKTFGLEFDLIAAHINHNIREEAKSDEDFVVRYCKEKNIDVYVLSIDLNKKAKQEKKGTEEAGRNARYEFFEKILIKTKANKIATAHTANDNAETVLMNIIRGSGTSGLKGIRPIRENKFIRPLIETTREEIENYCDEHKLNPRIDKTNFENEYTRNKTRNILIPLIKEKFNPNIIITINRLSNIINEENEYLEKLTKQKYKEMIIEENIGKQIILDLKLFNRQDLVIKKRLILHTINMLQGTTQGIGKVHIDDIIKLCENNLGNKYLTPNKNIKVLIKNKKIYYSLFTINY